MSGEGGSGKPKGKSDVDNTARKVWDKESYTKAAEKRDKEEEVCAICIVYAFLSI